MIRLKTQLILAGCMLCVSSQSIANEKTVANEYFNGSTIAFDYKDNFSNATISISGPDGFNTSTFQENGGPIVNLSNTSRNDESLEGSSSSNSSQETSLADGLYNYEITVASDKKVTVTDKQNNGRGKNAKTTMNVSETQSGHFRVKDGSIVTYLDIKEGE